MLKQRIVIAGIAAIGAAVVMPREWKGQSGTSDRVRAALDAGLIAHTTSTASVTEPRGASIIQTIRAFAGGVAGAILGEEAVDALFDCFKWGGGRRSLMWHCTPSDLSRALERRMRSMWKAYHRGRSQWNERQLVLAEGLMRASVFSPRRWECHIAATWPSGDLSGIDHQRERIRSGQDALHSSQFKALADAWVVLLARSCGYPRRFVAIEYIDTCEPGVRPEVVSVYDVEQVCSPPEGTTVYDVVDLDEMGLIPET